MENLHIKKTKYTVSVNFSAENGLLELEGASYPENAFEFYKPLMDWVTQYAIQSAPPEITVNLKINYLNTSSSKSMYDFLELLGKYGRNGGKLQINWYYERNDDDMLETGKELMDDAEVVMNLLAY